jgi:hypothetical protein
MGPAVEGKPSHRFAKLLEQLGQQDGVRPGLGQPRGRLAIGTDELHEDLGLLELHRIRHRQSHRPQLAEDVELGHGPLAGDHRLAEVGAPSHRAGLAAAPHAAPLEVARVPVEQPPVVSAIALGRHDDVLVRVAGHPPLQQMDVGFLAGLEDAEVGVDRAECGDDPVGSRFRAVHRPVPRRPAFAFRRAVGVGVNGEAVGLPAVGEMVRHCESPEV